MTCTMSSARFIINSIVKEFLFLWQKQWHWTTQLNISGVVLLNHLWEVSSDRSMSNLNIELKDFAYMKVKA